MPTAGLAQPLRFRQVRFTSSEGLLRPLLFTQIENEHDALIRTFKQRASNQHGQAAAIFPEKLLLVWLKNPGCQCLWFAKTPADREINNIACCRLTTVLL
jgi:hypothetical protein